MDIIRKTDEYERHTLTPWDTARDQLRHYLTRFKHIPEGDVDVLLDKIIEDHTAKQKEPEIIYFHRPSGEDKEVKQDTLKNYLLGMKERGNIIAPTLTGYTPKDIKLSYHSEYILNGLSLRNEAKGRMFAALAAGNMEKYFYNNLAQTNHKLANNIVSGVYGVQGTPIYNKSTHPMLTSGTRVTTNTANVIIERLLSATIMFRNPEVVRNYINNIVMELHTNKAESFPAMMKKYKLAYPSLDQLHDFIKTNIDRYWEDAEQYNVISKMLHDLTCIERAAVMYTGNLWSIKELNEPLVRELFDKLLKPIIPTVSDKDSYLKHIKSTNDDVLNATHHLLMELLVSKGSNHSAMSEDILVEIHATVRHIESVIEEYSDLLRTMLVTEIVPPDMAYTKSMARVSVIGSDTDSNLFTMSNWVEWYTGQDRVSPLGTKVVGITSMFVGFISDDALRQLSINLNIAKADIDVIEMKSEYSPSVLAMVGLTKTYFQYIKINEKSVLEKQKMIIKGVHLKSSAGATELVKGAGDMMEHIVKTLSKGELLDHDALINKVLTVERLVVSALVSGDTRYNSSITIKEDQNYKNRAPKNPSIWEHYWGDLCPTPLPSRFIRLSVTIGSKGKTNLWLDTLPVERANEIRAWMKKWGRTSFTTIYLPKDYANAYGIPEELVSILDIGKTIKSVTNMFYIILRSVSFYKQKRITLLEDYGYDLADVIKEEREKYRKSKGL